MAERIIVPVAPGFPEVVLPNTRKKQVSGQWRFCVETDVHPNFGEQVVLNSVLAVVTFSGGVTNTYGMTQVGTSSVYKTGTIMTTPSNFEPMSVVTKATYIYTNQAASGDFLPDTACT